MKFKVNIDTVGYDHKPKESVGTIKNRMAGNIEELELTELLEKATHGYSFYAGEVRGTAQKDWVSQQLFLVDYDGGKYKTIDDLLEQYRSLGIRPAFYYETFSSTAEDMRCRVGFIMAELVTDQRVRKFIQISLMKIAEDSDSSVKNADRLWFGSNKGYEILDTKPVTAENILVGIVSYYLAKGMNHFSRNIYNFCEEVSVNIYDHVFYPKIIINKEYVRKFTRGQFAGLYYNYKSSAVRPHQEEEEEVLYNNAVFSFAVGSLRPINENDKNNKVEIHKFKANFDKKEIRDIDLNSLPCYLWQEFLKGEYIHHPQLFGLFCNISVIRGGQKLCKKTLEDNKDIYGNKLNNKLAILTCIKKSEYAPAKCSGFCPYKAECPNRGDYIINLLNNKRGGIKKLSEEDTGKITVTQLRDSMKQLFEDFRAKEDNGIYIFKACTGAGKTELLKDLEGSTGNVICAPTHRLKAEMAKRLECLDPVVVEELKLTNEDLQAGFNNLQSKGAYKEAINYVYQNGSDKDIEILKAWMKNCNEARTSLKNILVTQKMFLTLNNPNAKAYFIDEDILLDTLMVQVNITPAMIEDLITKAKALNLKGLQSNFEAIQQAISTKPIDRVVSLNTNIIKESELKAFYDKYSDNIEINIKELLRVKAITGREINGQYTATGMYIESLPNKKIIIFSATADAEIYRALFKNREVNEITFPTTETEGRVILHYYGMSRQYLKNNMDKAIKTVQSEVPSIKNMITFAKYEDKFRKAGYNTICHFGACEGIDDYKGQDLIVLGTPHVNEITYLLLAHFIGGNDITIEEMEYQNAEYNGYEFYINTYKNCSMPDSPQSNILQRIQFYMINTQLEQAIGRARILTNPCTVHVFSNFPPKGSILNK